MARIARVEKNKESSLPCTVALSKPVPNGLSLNHGRDEGWTNGKPKTSGIMVILDNKEAQIKGVFISDEELARLGYGYREMKAREE